MNRTADVCMILEGTYPYVPGGVSTWVDQIIRGLPEISFALFFIGSRKDLTPPQYYKLPENVLSLSEAYLYEDASAADISPGKVPARLKAPFYQTLLDFYLAPTLPEQVELFWKLIEHLEPMRERFSFGNLCRDTEAWEILIKLYERFASDESFLDYFWTTRFLNLPLWRIWQFRERMPPARVYHSISTGYAGLLGALAARVRNVPYLLTEHGIYTKERIAEISQAEWIYESQSLFFSLSKGFGKLKQMWIRLFHFLGYFTYSSTDQVITLFEANARLQIEYGADPRKIKVITNAIDPHRFDEAFALHEARRRENPAEKNVGFVGRVVPIKDVKTLIRAANLVRDKMPAVRFLLAGGTSEDPDYYQECLAMVQSLGLEEHVKFLGNQNVMDLLPKLDVMVLTSISEGLPLVILEAFGAGVPVVSSNVGACRELLFGRIPADKALGKAGLLTRISAPAETAAALWQLLNNPALLRDMGQAGRQRVERFYIQAELLNQYRSIYQDTSWSPKGAPAPPAALSALP